VHSGGVLDRVDQLCGIVTGAFLEDNFHLADIGHPSGRIALNGDEIGGFARGDRAASS
jgi:hypothetical protein